MTTVAVMQPYFVPYAGYFRLFAAADLFVVYDCVQFPRRGWVHRNRLPTADGRPGWLTLPVAKAPRETRIADMILAPDSAAAWAARMRRFPALAGSAGHPVLEAVRAASGGLTDYLERALGAVCAALGLPFRTQRSSSLAIDPALRGQDRILAILDRLGGRAYVNAPGGRELYDPAEFARRGVDLRFLAPYAGAGWSVLHRLTTEDPAALGAEIRRQA
jgi:hypothetical protein